MIQRKGEKVLSWIGIVLNFMYTGFIGLMITMMFKKEILTEAINQDPDASAQYYHSYSIIMNMGTGFIIFLIVLLIIAIVATIIINKNPKLAGILLLIIGII